MKQIPLVIISVFLFTSCNHSTQYTFTTSLAIVPQPQSLKVNAGKLSLEGPIEVLVFSAAAGEGVNQNQKSHLIYPSNL